MAEVTDIEDVGMEIEPAAEDKEQSAESTESAQESKTTTEKVIPRKYQGRSVEELVDELERTKHSMGKYANELGEVRRLADELIKSQLTPEKKEEPAKEVDFFENPQEAIRRQIEQNPEVQAAKQYAVQARQAQAKAEFEKKHPDAQAILQEKEFGDWLMASKVRQKLWKEAVAYDVDSADELFSTYKQLKAVKAAQTQSKVDEDDKASRDAALKSASVETSGTGESSKKIYRRADLINLRLRDPAKFAAMEDEINAAYRERRVR